VNTTLPSGGSVDVPTGLKIKLPLNFQGSILPSLLLQEDILPDPEFRVLKPGFEGEVIVKLLSGASRPFSMHDGYGPIAYLVLVKDETKDFPFGTPSFSRTVRDSFPSYGSPPTDCATRHFKEFTRNDQKHIAAFNRRSYLLLEIPGPGFLKNSWQPLTKRARSSSDRVFLCKRM
jgi:hypothetical protein